MLLHPTFLISYMYVTFSHKMIRWLQPLLYVNCLVLKLVASSKAANFNYMLWLTVPIRRNLTGNAWPNVFCSRSARVLIPVLYPFGIRSVPVPYPFCFVLFPFCQCSIGKCSWNSFRRTRFPRTRLQECFQGISNTRFKLPHFVCVHEYKQ